MVFLPKVLVVGEKSSEEYIIEPLRKRFHTVVFAVPDEINLKAGERNEAFFNHIDLTSFSYALFLPGSSKREFYHALALILHDAGVKVSVSMETLLYIWHKPVLFRKLAGSGIPVRRIYAISQDVAGEVILKELKLPVIIIPPSGKAVYVTKEETLRSVLSLFPAGHMVVAQKPMKVESTLVVFVSPRDFVAYERKGNSRKAVVPDDKAKEIAAKVREVIDSDFCTVFLLKKGNRYVVSDVKLLPPFKTFKEVTGKDIGSIIASEIEEQLPSFDIGEFIGRMVEKFVRWVERETGNIRPPAKGV